MKTFSSSPTLYKAAVSAFFGLFLGATTAQATPMIGDIINGSTNQGSYSLIHFGATGSGSGNRNDWWHFDAGQRLIIDTDVDTSGTSVSLFAPFSPQLFALTTRNNATGSVLFTGLDLDLNDTDGFFSGTLDYVLNQTTTGQFVFTNQNFTSIFNTSSLVGDTFSFTLWGGDLGNDLGIDIAFTGSFLTPVVSSSGVPLPATGLLMLVGFTGIFLNRRR